MIYEKKHTESLWLVPAVQPDARLTLCSCSVIRLQLVFIKAVVSYFWWFSGVCHQLCHSELNYNMPLQWKNKTFFQLVCCRLRLKASSLTVSRGRLRMLRWMEFVEDAAHIGGYLFVCAGFHRGRTSRSERCSDLHHRSHASDPRIPTAGPRLRPTDHGERKNTQKDTMMEAMTCCMKVLENNGFNNR